MTEGMHTLKCISTRAIYCVGGNFKLALHPFPTVPKCFRDEGLKTACEFCENVSQLPR